MGLNVMKLGLVKGLDFLIWLSEVKPIKWMSEKNKLYTKRLDREETISKITDIVVNEYESMFKDHTSIKTDELKIGFVKNLYNQLGSARIKMRQYAGVSLKATSVLHKAHLESRIAELEKKIKEKGESASDSLKRAPIKLMRDHDDFCILEKTGRIETVQYLSKYYAKEIVADYNPTFYRFFKSFAKKTIVKHIYKNMEVTFDSENLAEQIRDLIENHAVMFVSNHLSNTDHAPNFFALNKYGIRQPSTVAGKNLDHGFSHKIFPRVNARWLHRGIMVPPEKVNKVRWYNLLRKIPNQEKGSRLWNQLKEHGVGWVNNPLYRSTDQTYTHVQLDAHDPILFYIEGGRSKDGKLREPKTVILQDGLDYVKKHSKPLYIIPITLSSTVVGEDRSLELGRLGQDMTEGDLISQLSYMNKIVGKRAPLYVHYAKPIEVKPGDLSQDNKEYTDQVQRYAEQIMTTIGSNVKNTSTYLLANTICRNDYAINFTFEDAKKDMLALARYLEGDVNESEIEKMTRTGLKIFEKRGFVKSKNGKRWHFFKRKTNMYQITNMPLLRQYSNRIAHQFDQKEKKSNLANSLF